MRQVPHAFQKTPNFSFKLSQTCCEVLNVDIKSYYCDGFLMQLKKNIYLFNFYSLALSFIGLLTLLKCAYIQVPFNNLEHTFTMCDMGHSCNFGNAPNLVALLKRSNVTCHMLVGSWSIYQFVLKGGSVNLLAGSCFIGFAT